MSMYRAEEVNARIDSFHGHPLTVAERAELFCMAREYAALLRERESAKAAVTDAVAARAEAFRVETLKKIASYGSAGVEDRHNMAMRAALEAVAPMLASARVPEGTKNLLLEAYDFGQFSSDFNYPQAISVRRAICEICDWLAAAPKPETEG